MFTLTIEHAISDFPTWEQAFDRFAEAREKAGVLSHRVRRAVDDPLYLVIELDFDVHDNADTFRQFLHSRSNESPTGLQPDRRDGGRGRPA